MADFVSTKAALQKKNASKSLLTIAYNAPEKKSLKISETIVDPKIQSQSSNERNVDLRRKQELEMKRIRFEVMKFGMTGFEKNKAQEAKVALAISLGAKPPKNKKKNYKVLQEERHKEKQKALQMEHFQSGLSSSLVTITKKKKRMHKKESGILGVYGKVQKN